MWRGSSFGAVGTPGAGKPENMGEPLSATSQRVGLYSITGQSTVNPLPPVLETKACEGLHKAAFPAHHLPTPPTAFFFFFCASEPGLCDHRPGHTVNPLLVDLNMRGDRGFVARLMTLAPCMN